MNRIRLCIRFRSTALAGAAATLALSAFGASPGGGTQAGAHADNHADAPPALERLELHIAQAGPVTLERRPVGDDGGPQFMRIAAAEAGGERVVKGAPYCAEAVHETVQWLPDGAGGAPNRIVRQQTTQLCRDGEGRTRQEVQRGNRKLVYLRDPVAREFWMLDPERKLSYRVDSRGHADSAAWRDYSERMREWARGVAERAKSSSAGGAGSHAQQMGSMPPMPPIAAVPPLPPTPPTPVVISRPEAGRENVEVNIVRLREGAASAEAAAHAEAAVAPPAVQWRASTFAPRGAGTVSPLPARDIDGLRANGERTTWVIEAGKVGNEKPIQITREVWTSPELMVTLSSRDFDPRSGEVNYRLRNVRRGEPDAALMRVPADYKAPESRPRGGKAASGATG
jgi:hypothetical protein